MTIAAKSRRSGGPQTAEGKIASSRNLLKVGVALSTNAIVMAEEAPQAPKDGGVK